MKLINNKRFAIISLVLSVIVGIACLIYGINLEQLNSETLFLTQEGREQYWKFQKDFNEKDFAVIKKSYSRPINEEDKQDFLKRLIPPNDTVEIITSEKLVPSFKDLFNLEGDNFLGALIIAESDKDSKDLLRQYASDPKFSNGLKIVGVSYTNILLDQYSESIKKTLFPALFAGVFILLLFFTKSILVSSLLFLPCLFSAGLSLASTKFLFGSSNLITSIVPLLMFVINLSVVLHLYFTSVKRKSFVLGLKEKIRPTFLMIITTFVGFLSLYFSDLEAIRLFGTMSAVLILASSLIAISWLFLADMAFNFSQLSLAEIHYARNFFNFFAKPHRIPLIIFIAIFSLVLGLFSLPEIPVITDATQYFPPESRLREQMIEVSKTVAGTPVLELVIHQEALNYGILKKYAELENKLKEIDENFQIISSNELVAKINKTYSGVEKIPDLSMQYAPLRMQIPPSLQEGFPVDDNYRITFLGPPTSVKDYEFFLEKVKNTLEKSAVQYSFNGLYYQLMVAQKEMILTLFKSFLAGLVVISIIAFITFRRLKVFFIFMGVNILPVFLSFLFFRLFQTSFNIATVMTYSISLGLIVDSTFHILHALDAQGITKEYYVDTIVRPVLGGSIVLAICFFLFALNGFLPIREFGICLGVIIVIGAYFDLKILPGIYLDRPIVED